MTCDYEVDVSDHDLDPDLRGLSLEALASKARREIDKQDQGNIDNILWFLDDSPRTLPKTTVEDMLRCEIQQQRLKRKIEQRRSK